MNANDAQTQLNIVFSKLYQDLIQRNCMNHPLTYNQFGSLWNIGTLGGTHSVNLGVSKRPGQALMISLQARKPQSDGVQAAEKFLFYPGEIARLSYITAYYLQATRGPVNMAQLNQAYAEFSSIDRAQLHSIISQLDDYLTAA